MKVRPGLKRAAKELNNDPMSGSFFDDRNQLLKMIKEPQFFMITNNLILSKRRRRQYLRQTRSIRTTAARRRRGLMSDQSGTPWCTLFIKHTFKTPERVCVSERERKREIEREGRSVEMRSKSSSIELYRVVWADNARLSWWGLEVALLGSSGWRPALAFTRLTIYHYHLSLPFIITIYHYHLSLPFIITIYYNHLPCYKS